jgi:hypothetical protein
MAMEPDNSNSPSSSGPDEAKKENVNRSEEMIN